MKLVATISEVTDNLTELAVVLRGWAEIDAPGTRSRPLGAINVPSTARTRKSYYIGRRLIIDVRPA